MQAANAPFRARNSGGSLRHIWLKKRPASRKSVMPHSGRILCRDVIPSAVRSGGPRRAYRTRALRMRHEIIFRSRTGLMLFLLITHIRPIIEYCFCVWSTGYQGDLRLLESVQRRWTKQISSVNSLEYADRLRTLNLFSVKGRLLRADLIQCWKIFHGVSCVDVSDIFLLTPCRGTRGHCYKIFTLTIQTDVRKRFFNVRCVSIWNSLPQYVVSAPSLSSFKNLLENSLGDVLFVYEGWLKSFEPHTENEEIGRLKFVCTICGMFAHVLHGHLVGSTFYYIFPCSLS